MATSNFQTHKPLSVLLATTLTFFLLLLNKVTSKESHSFTFTNFAPNQPNLILQGDALVTSEGKLRLTKVESNAPVYQSLGRAIYSAPIRIWDNTTGNVASFTTSFSFIIYAPDKSTTADGLAFFLSKPNSEPQTAGGYLGLFNDQKYNKSNQVVAVEFDTYTNSWDPQNKHIGIDVNTIKSTKAASWALANGEVANVVISYKASTGILVAYVVHPSRKTSYIVSTNVDLKTALPEWVSVGFSATTGLNQGYVETHDILSWSFVSTFPDACSALESNEDLESVMLHHSM